MARLNLTIPDALYARLEQLRDRVNVSKICAAALTKELDMIEGTVEMANDMRVQRMVQRLLREREVRERWYLRGRSDGETWAVERASFEELRKVGDEWDDAWIEHMQDLDEIDEDAFPSLNARELLFQWEHGTPAEAGETADWRGYIQGWYHGARDMWRAGRSALQ